MTDSIRPPRFFSVEQLQSVPPPQWAIDELFEVDSLTLVSGPPGSYKSFLALDWLLTMASGRSHWAGRAIKPGKVAYALGEGRNSLLTRIKGWKTHNRPTPEQDQLINDNFKVTFEVPQLAHKANLDNMLRDLDHDNFKPSILVIDTFARSFVNLDENSSKDVGMWIEQAEYLRSLGMAVVILHHTAKNTEFGVRYRGSTALMGAMDTAMNVVKDNPRSNRMVLSVVKQKNYEEIPSIPFQACKITWTGNPEGAIVLVPDIPRVTIHPAEDPVLSNKLIKQILTDYPTESQRQSARRLAERLGIGDTAALGRIHRYLVDNKGVVEGLDIGPEI